MAVDGDISDLFFNTNVSSAAIYEQDEFRGYDHPKMLEEAVTFLRCLGRLGVIVPAAEELVQDFYKRV